MSRPSGDIGRFLNWLDAACESAIGRGVVVAEGLGGAGDVRFERSRVRILGRSKPPRTARISPREMRTETQ
jgi:hypothetical protein